MKKEKNEDIEIVIGDKKDLNFSEAKDCVNTLRPKNKETLKNKPIIPKSKK